MTTILDRQKVCSGIIHPDPRCAWLVAVDHLPHIADLLFDSTNASDGVGCGC
jgi:hypothetical protein